MRFDVCHKYIWCLVFVRVAARDFTALMCEPPPPRRRGSCRCVVCACQCTCARACGRVLCCVCMPVHMCACLWPRVGAAGAAGVRECGPTALPTQVADQTAALESIGEATPIGPNGTCVHPLTVPNNARTQCILPSRVDVGRHYLVRPRWQRPRGGCGEPRHPTPPPASAAALGRPVRVEGGVRRARESAALLSQARAPRGPALASARA